MIQLLLYILLTPQSELPYVDALPLDYPQRRVVIDRCTCLARNVQQDCSTYPTYREGTRFLLIDGLLNGESPHDLLYLLGRIQGRHYLWQTYIDANGYFCTGYIDEIHKQPEE